MGQSQSGASIPAGTGEVENSAGGKNAGHRAAYSQKKQQEEDLELLKKPKGAEVSEWACDFLFSGTVYLAYRNIRKKWTMPIANWATIAQQLAESKIC